MTIPLDEIKVGFAAAWHDLCFFPLPAFLRGRGDGGEDAFRRLFFYPVLGALAGGLLLCIGWLSELFVSRTGAALIFGLCSLLVLEGKDRVQGLSSQVRALVLLFAGDNSAESLRQMLGSAFFTLLLLAKLAGCTSLFFHGSGGMVGAALIVNFALRSELLGFGDVNPRGVPAMECTMQQRRVLRGTALLLLFLAALSQPALFLLLGMGGTLLLLAVERLAIRRGTLEPETIAFWGGAAETAALLSSALLTL